MALSTKLLLAAVSAASTAYASGCSASTTTLSSGGDVSAVASCTTFSGSIVIQTGAAVNNEINLDGVKKITGALSHENDNNTQTFSATDLQTIGGTFTLANLSSLSTISLGSLTQAADIVFNGLGSLTELGIGGGSNNGLESAGQVLIENTKISDLTGLNNVTQLETIEITDNPFLAEIEFTGVSKINSIFIGPNDVTGESGVTFSMPNLTTADVIDVQNCSSVALPSLMTVSSAFKLIGNTFPTIVVNKLTWAGNLIISDNTEMRNMSFPALSALNGTNSTLSVQNNTKLMSIGGFNDLHIVTGDVSLAGNFSNVTFKEVSHIGGALNIDTASSDFDCSTLPKAGSQIVDGSIECKIGDKTKVGGTTTGTTTGSTSSSFAFAHEIPASFMPIFPLIAGLLFA